MRSRLTALAAVAALVGCGGPAPDPLAAVTVPPLPDWTDRYADSNQGDVRFFNISALMARYELSRLQAVAAQNHYRDLTRATPEGDREAQLAEAVARVRRGELESGLDPKALAAARVVVVFDLDDTLYDQYGATAACHDLSYGPEQARKYIQRAPGWEKAFERIRDLGGAVAIFSANLDAPTLENLRHWEWDGRPLVEHPKIAGVLTNSHLVLQEKSEGPGAKDPRRGQPVVEPSKDLRVFDPSLQRVLIVDDNPERLFQLGNTRLFKKLHAEAWCEPGEMREAYARALATVVDEIEASLAWAEREGVDFVTAWRPYSMMGQVAVRLLTESRGWTRAEAVDFLRRHPEHIDARF